MQEASGGAGLMKRNMRNRMKCWWVTPTGGRMFFEEWRDGKLALRKMQDETTWESRGRCVKTRSQTTKRNIVGQCRVGCHVMINGEDLFK